MCDFVYQVTDNSEVDNQKITWVSAGIRPVYSFTKHLALVFEAGVDWVDNDPLDAKGALFKFTIAPEIRFGFLFFDRPVLRLYVTYATWSDDFRGLVGEEAYEDDTHGLSAGVQCEAWW